MFSSLSDPRIALLGQHRLHQGIHMCSHPKGWCENRYIGSLKRSLQRFDRWQALLADQQAQAEWSSMPPAERLARRCATEIARCEGTKRKGQMELLLSLTKLLAARWWSKLFCYVLLFVVFCECFKLAQCSRMVNLGTHHSHHIQIPSTRDAVDPLKWKPSGPPLNPPWHTSTPSHRHWAPVKEDLRDTGIYPATPPRPQKAPTATIYRDPSWVSHGDLTCTVTSSR